MNAWPLLLSLLAAVIKAGLLLALAAGLVAALGRAPARTRHSIWASALVGALLLPVLAPWVPDWSIAALPAPRLSTERPAPVAAPSRPARLGRPADRSERIPSALFRGPPGPHEGSPR